MTTEPAAPTTAFRDLRRAVVDRMPDLVERIARALREEWPEHAQFLVDNTTEVVESATAVVEQLLALTATGLDIRHDPDHVIARDLFEEIGRVQWREGKELTELLSAYRTGVRVFWEHAAAMALEVGVEPGTVAALARGVFLFVDQLSSSSAHGYVLEQAEAGAEREHHRDALVGLLLSDRADEASVRTAARRAGWPLPREVVVVLEPPHDTPGRRVLSRVGPGALAIRRLEAADGVSGAIVPYPAATGGVAALRRTLHGIDATVGPAVAPGDVPASLQIARIAAHLREDALLGTDAAGPVFAAEHLDAVIVHRDRGLLDTLRDDVLRPLERSGVASRARLRETLRAWLLSMGDRRVMAEQLHVHPQTVRYRLTRLRELFGADLDDPATRARLTLALCWDR